MTTVIATTRYQIMCDEPLCPFTLADSARQVVDVAWAAHSEVHGHNDHTIVSTQKANR